MNEGILMKLTIFTPTYNRGELLKKLYLSLCKQKNKNFCWLIVDDGSTDNTKQIVEKFISEQKLDISYVLQPNSGKHVAHNLGVRLCKTELFFCVDSDDYLTSNAVQEILDIWNTLSANEINKISGIVAYRGTSDMNIIGTEFPLAMDVSPLNYLYSNGKKGDTALIYRTEVLRQYPFPVFGGEKFLRENIAYDLIDEKYSLLVLRKIIYICEYLDDGLSKNSTKYEMESPNGAALYRYNEYLKNKKSFFGLRQLAGYFFFSIKAKKTKVAWKKIGIFKGLILLPIVLAGAIRYKIILKK